MVVSSIHTNRLNTNSGNLFPRGSYVRLFNASGDDSLRDLGIGIKAGEIELVELDGRVIETLEPITDEAGQQTVRLQIPRFGIRTLRFSNVQSPDRNERSR
jgi:hypothetical protein